MLKIGHNLKFDLLVFAQHGIDARSIEDIMLISYVLDAGRSSHDLDSLAEGMLGHTPLTQDAVTGTGKNRAVVRHGADREGRRICEPERRRDWRGSGAC